MIICDSREKKNSHILHYFDKHKIPYKVTKMAVADYMIEGKDKFVIDRKQNLDEVCSNLTYKGKTARENGGKKIPSDVARFWREIRLAHDNHIKVIVLVEHGANVRKLADVALWNSTKSRMSGRKLLDEMDRVSTAYGVEWQFCTKAETPRKILEILDYRSENDA